MSTWNDINLSELSVTIDAVKPGDYTFQLLPGAKRADRDNEVIEASAAITEGEFAGRKLFFSYPNPAKYDWSPRVFKRLEQAIGTDFNPGEHPIEYLNRVAGSRFGASVKNRTDSEGVVRAELNIFTTRAAA